MAILNLAAKPTLTAVEMNTDDVVRFALADGGVREIVLLDAWAKVLFTTLDQLKVEQRGARTFYQFGMKLRIDAQVHELVREVPTHRSFYEPWVIAGVRIWPDAVSDIFDFLVETHGPCKPAARARLAMQDATLRICPELVHPWCPLPKGGLNIDNCYCGEDCWMGPYFGASAHGGLDINHPRGTPIWAPFDLDDHYLFHSVATGANNNRWRGRRDWGDGSQWIIQCHHMTRLTVPEHTPLTAGTQYADGAGVWVGSHNHSHFTFRIADADAAPIEDTLPDGHKSGEGAPPGILLDPWILFWQMYQDKVGYPDKGWK